LIYKLRTEYLTVAVASSTRKQADT